MLVFGHQPQHVGLADVGLVAEADRGAHTEAVVLRPVGDCRHHGATLPHDGQRTVLGDDRPEDRAQTVRAVGDALDVGPKEAQAALARDPQDLSVELRLARLASSGADDDRAGRAFVGSLVEHSRHEFGRHGDHDQVQRAGDVADTGVTLKPGDHLGSWVHRDDFTGVATRQDRRHQDPAELGRILGCTYDGDAPRLQHPPDRVVALH